MRAAPRKLGRIILGGVLAGGLLLGGCTTVREEAPRPLSGGLDPKPAQLFLESVGVNVHLTYYDTAYARFDEWSRRLADLGVRHLRDGLVPGDPRYVERLSELGRQGRRFTLIVDPSEGPARDSVALATGPLGGAVEALEGPNELDVRLPEWEGVLREFMPDLRRAVDALPDQDMPLLGPSFVNADLRPRLDDVAGAWNIENAHPYPGGEAPFPLDGADLPAGQRRPVMATETGYHNALAATEGQPPVSEEAAGVYAPRLVAENFASGIRRSFFYELIDEKPDPDNDDPEQHFGLLRQDLSPKPSYRALRNLLRAVRSSPGEGPDRGVRVERGPDDLGRLLLARDDGSRCLLLWRRQSVWDIDARRSEAVSAVPVRLAFGGTARDIELDYPSQDEEGAPRPDADQLTVPVGADVVVINFR